MHAELGNIGISGVTVLWWIQENYCTKVWNCKKCVPISAYCHYFFLNDNLR